MAHRKSWLARQPVKTVYTVCAAVRAIARLSFLSIYYIPHSLRPRKTWTWKLALGSEATRLSVVYVTAIQLQVPMSLEPGDEGERFVKCSPRADLQAFYSGILQSNKNIQPETLGGTWYPHCYDKDTSNKVVLHFHGGAFVLLDSREEYCGHGLRTLSEQFDGIPVFCPEYRLATSPTGKWPAPLQDAVTSYLYLLYELNIDPSRIILSGDSAGGTLALALLRYIISSQSRVGVNALPLPVAVLLWSPWVNGHGTDDEANKDNRNKGIDTIGPGFLKWGLQELTDNETIISSSDPYLCPLAAPFKTDSVPLWMQIGTAELFYNPVQKFAKKMRAVGNTVHLYEIPDAVHDPLISWKLGFQEELKEGMRQAWDMVNNTTNGRVE
ncbi:hypothetical protein UA08_01871 [Talaromyces atroroseus]|uniref:Alpha/beta hydrolase fold-3 domain-containing protein n=1 Tax=Talaromyces atroroseus TaxID=1441469 RepID=A0A1Q5QA57_TALAT|nr:hypothetical protein UA08_01871 [Talaromyces atroroseus]OKL62812.1 hypothetical protein UA08_01871 [Talaromyces atroroseus]